MAPRLSFFTYGVHGGCLAGAILVLSAEIYAGCVMNVDKKNVFWKERNRRVFEKKTMTAPLVFNCILEEMSLRQAALRALSAT